MASNIRSRHPLYQTWCTMHASCYNPNNPSYPYTGAVGITVCPRWREFELFVEDVKIKKPGRFFTRPDKKAPFHPGNWAWMTAPEWKHTSQTCRLTKEDVAEMRKAYIPRVVTLKQLAKRFGCSTTTVHSVIHYESWK